MRLKNLVVVWVLLTAGFSNARETSPEWLRDRDQSWEQTRVAFPQSAVAGPFLSRMLQIDAWAKVNNPSLYNNSNKPYLLAQMVQREVDEQRATPQTDEERQFDERFKRSVAQATAAYPDFAKPESPLYKRVAEMDMALRLAGDPLFESPEKPMILAERAVKALGVATNTGAGRTNPANPAVSSPAPQPSNSASLQEIVQSHAPNPDRPAIRLGYIIIIAITSAVAILFFRIVSPKPGVRTAVALGRRWAAWAGFFATFSVLPQFFRKFDASSLALWILAIGFFTPVAFVVGWIVGFYKYRQPATGSQHGNPPDALDGHPAPSPAKTGKLTKPNDFQSPEVKPSTQEPMNKTEFEVRIPEGKELENGYVEMRHNTQYSLALRNHRSVRCDAEVVIDGTHVGTWRIGKSGEIRIERPVHDTGHFTFFTVGTEEARIAGIVKSPENGLVSVTFTPERKRDLDPLCASPLPECGQGATGLTGESKQRFVDADEIEHDTARAFTIHLRLVSAKPDIRPLAPRSTPIPPPID